MQFYCGLAETAWSRYPTAPGPHTCISPVYGTSAKRKYRSCISLPPDTLVLQDSGAFSDGPGDRLPLPEALTRQERHALIFGYEGQLELRASYDVLIDEMWQADASGAYTRSKRRWSESAAEEAVEETVRAAAFLSAHRNGIGCVLSIQGVTAEQYLACAKRIVPYYRTGDRIGLGGWCIIGKYPAQMMPVFRKTLRLVMPFLAAEGIPSVHIWGVCYLPALVELLWWADLYGIEVSTDSVGPSTRPIRSQWGYMGWTDLEYKTAPLISPEEEHLQPKSLVKGYDGRLIALPYTRGAHRAEHVRQTRGWLAHLRETKEYQALTSRHSQIDELAGLRQLSFFSLSTSLV